MSDPLLYRDMLFEQLMAGDPPGSHVFKVGDKVRLSGYARPNWRRGPRFEHEMTVYEVCNYTTGQIVYASEKGLGSIRFPWLTKYMQESVVIGNKTWYVGMKD